MNKFYPLLNQPHNIHTLSDLQFLKTLTKEYPWFGIGQLLMLKSMQNIDDPRFEKMLSFATIFTSNMSSFADLLNPVLSKTKERKRSKIDTIEIQQELTDSIELNQVNPLSKDYFTIL